MWQRKLFIRCSIKLRGKMYTRVLNFALVSFLCCTQLHGRYINPDNCLKVDDSNNCVCCSPGYRGQTCGEKCDNCLSRHSSARGCEYYCRTGFYGTRCNEICPRTCADGVTGPHACSVTDGVVSCDNGCVPGFYGTQCDRGCSTTCLNNICYQATGRCIECNGKHYHGDKCDKQCSKGCENQVCERSGKCIDGCHVGYHGLDCTSECGSNCVDGLCVSDVKHTYNCTRGCQVGNHGVDCRSKCGSNCVGGLCVSDITHTYNCTRGCQTGYRSVNCSELCTTELDGCSLPMRDTKENVKGLASPPLVIVIVVVATTITAAIVIIVCWWKKSHATFLCFKGSHKEVKEEEHPLLGGPGSCYQDTKKDILDDMIDEKRGTFVVTSIYNTVQTCLEEHGHVTISGALGEGKTSLALMIGDEYRQKGYKLLFVDDPETFTLDTDDTEKTVCIFDDIFRADRLGTSVSQLQKLLRKLQVRIEKSTETADGKLTRIQRQVQTNNLTNECGTFYVIFTMRSFNLRSAVSKLTDHEIYLFRSPTVYDLTTTEEYKYTALEKTNIFNKHKTHNNVRRIFPFEEICGQEFSMFGFPMICNLFFKVFSKVDILRFFSKPLEYLETELKSILNGSRENAAVLMLMILCEDGLNLIELESDQGHISEKLDKVQTLLGNLNRGEILSAARRFQGTFFTSDDISHFSHPAVQEACTFVIFDKFPGFILQNCCLKFLYERIHSDLAQTTTREKGDYTIRISEPCIDIIIGRLAEGIKQGDYSVTISHPILKNKEIVDKLFPKVGLNVKKTDSDHTQPTCLHSYDKDKCFLHWAAQANSLYLVEQILRIEPDFSPKEVEEAVEACTSSGNVQVLDLLLQRFSQQILEELIGIAFIQAACTGQQDLFQVLVETTQDIMFPGTTEDILLHIACKGGNKSIVKQILSSRVNINSVDSDGFTPIMRAVYNGHGGVFDLLISHGADVSLTDQYNDTVLHLACQGGNTSIVEQLLPSFDINIRGQHGWTPVMNAANSGKKEVFDLLVTNGAGLTLTDNYGNTVLHLACHGGNTSIVKHLLPSFDINIRGENEWTPVMNAADSGKKEVFDLLVTKGADLTLTATVGYTILHSACNGGSVDIVKCVLPLFDINVRGGNGQTPLTCSVSGGHVEVFDLLVSHCADVTVVDDDGDGLMHLACEKHNLDMVKHVLPLCDIDGRNRLRLTPAMLALLNGHAKVFEYLVDNGADMTAVDDAGDDLLTMAYRGGCKDVIQKLNQTDRKQADRSVEKIEKWTNLMCDVFYGSSYLLDHYEQGDPRLVQKDCLGDTVLHIACRGGNKQCVERLLPCYDINVRGRFDWTPVMMAARCGYLDVLKYLVSHQADLSLVSDTGEDVLTLARRGGNKDIVTYLENLSEFKERE